MKSIWSNIFKEQLSKNSPSAALLLRWICKKKQNKNLLSQVCRIPTVWFPQRSGVPLLAPLARKNASQQIRNSISMNSHLLEEATLLLQPVLVGGLRVMRMAGHSAAARVNKSSQLGQGRADGFPAVQTNCRPGSPSFWTWPEVWCKCFYVTLSAPSKRMSA